MNQDLVIKTTARLQEASEPDRQKPIIRIDDRDGRTTLSHFSDANELANTIRASIDSGRDNPFRPDGEIYRMTDPIVDFYKFGSNRSGTQTPTYATLMQPSSEAKRTKSDKKSKTSRLWKRREAPASGKQIQEKDTGDSMPQTEPKKRSCWRKLFCCCCYCNGHNARTCTQTNGNGRLSENIDHYNTATAAQGAKSQDLIISNSKLDQTNRRKREDDNSTKWDSNSPAAINSEAPPAVRLIKQTKVVIVDELPKEAAHNIAEPIPNEFRTYNDDNQKAANGAPRRVDGVEATSTSKKTAPKSTTSKCVVS